MLKELLSAKILSQLILTLGGYLLLAAVIPRTDFTSFIAIYTLLFFGYLLLIRAKLNLASIFTIGLASRLIFLSCTPSLSDDVYRFLWDGRLWTQGVNPFQYIPQYFIDNPNNLKGLEELYPHLNSKQYFAIYPPINQFIFGITALLVPAGFFKAQLTLKLILIAGELLLFRYGVKLLKTHNLNPGLIGLYFLNPLVIIEITGNLHFEGLMSTFVLASFYYLKTNRWALSSIAFAFAICTKLLPILYLPLLLPILGLSKTIKYNVLTLTVCALLFLPFLNLELAMNMLNSIDLYYQSFKFNSFIYSVLLDLLGEESKVWIGLILALIPALFILRLAFKKGDYKSVIERSFGAHTLYYIFSAVVHPWYLVTLLALNTILQHKFIIIWSYLIGLSYFTYRTLPYEESSFVIAIQYLVVLIWAAIEYSKQKNQSKLATA